MTGLPAIFQLPSERTQPDSRASADMQAKQAGYLSRPWAAHIATDRWSTTNRFTTLTEMLEDVRAKRARHHDFRFELSGPGGKFDEATAEKLLAAHAAKAGRPVLPHELQKARHDLEQAIRNAPWHQTEFTVHVPPRS